MADSTSSNPKIAGDASAIDKRIRRHVTGRMREYFAIIAPGVEQTCRQELIDLGLDGNQMITEAGGVTFSGRFVDCQRANLYLRTATRILMRIDAFSATNLRQLQRKTAALPWELFLPNDAMLSIKASSRRSRLYHTDAIIRSIQDGVGQRLAAAYRMPPSDLPQTLFARLVNDRVTLSLDSSGEPLYKRGMKDGQAQAPLRETMAAAILMAAGFDTRRPLVDPLCGSGSFSLEAAMMAKQMAPGMRRRFAFMGWPAFRDAQWGYLQRETRSSVKRLNTPLIFASDVDANACRRLAGAVARHGLSDAIRVTQKDVFDCQASQYGKHPGLVTINPPYGVRIGSVRQADDLFMRICRHLKEAFDGWDVALIAPHRHLTRNLPFPARQLPLSHGGLKLTLILGAIN